MAGAKILPFLMFQGQAEAALEAYAALFPDTEIVEVSRTPEGALHRATLSLAGQTVLVYDSPPIHAFGFTPSFSFMVECASDGEIEGYVAAMLEGGEALMPLDNYGFSRRYAWVNDRFGVSWQFNLA